MMVVYVVQLEVPIAAFNVFSQHLQIMGPGGDPFYLQFIQLPDNVEELWELHINQLWDDLYDEYYPWLHSLSWVFCGSSKKPNPHL